MANLEKGAKQLVLNAADAHPLAFHKKNAAGAYVKQAGFDATAERLVIEGFGQLEKGKATVARGAKGVAAQKQESRVNVAALAVGAVGGELTIKFKIKSFNLEAELMNWNSEYKDFKSYVIPIVSGDTNQTIAQKLKHSIDQENQDPYTSLLTAGTIYENGSELAMPAPDGTFNLPVLAARAGFEFELIVEHDAQTQGDVSVTMTTQKKAYEGRGSYRQMNILRLQTPGRMEPYSFEQEELPVKGAKYSNYVVTFTVDRPDLNGGDVHGGKVSGTYQLEVYANEASCAAWIVDFTKWLNANVAERHMHKADTADEVLAGDAVTSASAVEGTPFTTTLN